MDPFEKDSAGLDFVVFADQWRHILSPLPNSTGLLHSLF
jgi:hypothetical protein